MPLPDTRAVVVALVFGGLMAWGLARFSDERPPVVWATTIGIVAGLLTWILARGDDTVIAGMSLTLGCGVALVGFLLLRR